MTLLLFACLAVQDPELDALVRRLGSDSVEERADALAALRRRASAAVASLLETERSATTVDERTRLRRAIQDVLGPAILTPQAVRDRRIRWSRGELPLRKAVEELGRIAGLPIEVDGPPDADPTVNGAEIADRSLAEVLDGMAKHVSASWMVDVHRVVFLVGGRVALRLFDVRDLTWGIFDEPFVALAPDGGPTVQGTEARNLFSGEDLANLIRFTLSPDAWEEADGKSLQFQNGALLIRNTPEILRGTEALLDKLRREQLTDVRIEIAVIAAKAEAGIGAWTAERVVEEAGKGEIVRRIAGFDRVARDHVRVALECGTRAVLVAGYDEAGLPARREYRTGTRANVRVSPREDRTSMRIEFRAGLSRMTSVEIRNTPKGDVHFPAWAIAELSGSAAATPGRWIVLGRSSGTEVEEGFPETVMIGRFTSVDRRGR